MAQTPPSRPTCPHHPEVEDRGLLVHLTLKIQIKKLDGRRLLLSPEGHELILPSRPEPKPHIVDAIGLAYRWHDELVKSGMHSTEFARVHRVRRNRIHDLLPLTQLGPEVLSAALRGSLPLSVTLNDLRHAAMELDWQRQKRQLGLVEAES